MKHELWLVIADFSTCPSQKSVHLLQDETMKEAEIQNGSLPNLT